MYRFISLLLVTALAVQSIDPLIPLGHKIICRAPKALANRAPVSLHCAKNAKLEILIAMSGIQSREVCPAEIGIDELAIIGDEPTGSRNTSDSISNSNVLPAELSNSCDEVIETTRVIKEKCNSMNNCTIDLSEPIPHNCAHDTYSYMNITYRCVASKKIAPVEPIVKKMMRNEALRKAFLAQQSANSRGSNRMQFVPHWPMTDRELDEMDRSDIEGSAWSSPSGQRAKSEHEIKGAMPSQHPQQQQHHQARLPIGNAALMHSMINRGPLILPPAVRASVMARPRQVLSKQRLPFGQRSDSHPLQRQAGLLRRQ